MSHRGCDESGTFEVFDKISAQEKLKDLVFNEIEVIVFKTLETDKEKLAENTNTYMEKLNRNFHRKGT